MTRQLLIEDISLTTTPQLLRQLSDNECQWLSDLIKNFEDMDACAWFQSRQARGEYEFRHLTDHPACVNLSLLCPYWVRLYMNELDVALREPVLSDEHEFPF